MKDLIHRLRDGAAPLDDPNLNDEAADALEAQAAELARVSADARRLEWLRLNLEWDGHAYWLPDLCIKETQFGSQECPEPTPDEFRAAIDAATKETP